MATYPVEFVAENNKLYIHPDRGVDTEMKPESGKKFFFANGTDQQIEFETDNNGNAVKTWHITWGIKREKGKLTSLLTPDFVKSIQIDFQNSYHIASFYSYLGEKEKSLEYLENAVNKGFINYPLIAMHDKLLTNLHGEDRFKKLVERVKYEWENFKV